MLLSFKPPNALESVANFIQSDAQLNAHVLDVQARDDLLVVLTDSELTSDFVKPLLRQFWFGPIEIYSPSDMVIGA